jgi:NAD-dependent SIR2 family protein deacetylase
MKKETKNLPKCPICEDQLIKNQNIVFFMQVQRIGIKRNLRGSIFEDYYIIIDIMPFFNINGN